MKKLFTKKNALLGILLIGVFLVSFVLIRKSQSANVDLSKYSNYPQFTVEQLKEFDGSDLSKPIYIGFQGLVYDVSVGKDFYKADGGTYHYLAGKDSTSDLELIGGDIIQRKYPVIGTIIK